MIVFTIAHPHELAELRIEAPAGADGLTLRIEAAGGEFALSPGEADLLSDWLFAWLIDRDRRGTIRIERGASEKGA